MEFMEFLESKYSTDFLESMDSLGFMESMESCERRAMPYFFIAWVWKKQKMVWKFNACPEDQLARRIIKKIDKIQSHMQNAPQTR